MRTQNATTTAKLFALPEKRLKQELKPYLIPSGHGHDPDQKVRKCLVDKFARGVHEEIILSHIKNYNISEHLKTHTICIYHYVKKYVEDIGESVLFLRPKSHPPLDTGWDPFSIRLHPVLEYLHNGKKKGVYPLDARTR